MSLDYDTSSLGCFPLSYVSTELVLFSVVDRILLFLLPSYSIYFLADISTIFLRV